MSKRQGASFEDRDYLTSRFIKAPTRLTLNMESGQITCQTEADRSLVNNSAHRNSARRTARSRTRVGIHDLTPREQVICALRVVQICRRWHGQADAVGPGAPSNNQRNISPLRIVIEVHSLHSSVAGDHRAVLDFVREVRPPFSPEAVVPEFAAVLKTFSLTTAASDRYAGSWPTEAFRKHNITVEPSSRTKSEIYQAWLPMVMSSACELLDHARLLKQVGSLERRTARGGKDSIDHAPRMHDNVVNAAASALVLVVLRSVEFDWRAAGMTSAATWGDDDEWGPTGKWGHLPADVREREREAQAIRRKFGWEVGIVRDPFR